MYRTRSLLGAYAYISTGRKSALTAEQRDALQIENYHYVRYTCGALYLEYRVERRLAVTRNFSSIVQLFL